MVTMMMAAEWWWWRGGTWCWGSDRSDGEKQFWTWPENSPKKFSGGRKWRRRWLSGGRRWWELAEKDKGERGMILSKEDLKGTRIEHGFKRAFMSLFGQDDDTFISTMLINVDQLQKQLDKDEFQEDGSKAAFWVTSTLLNTPESRLNTSEIHYSITWVMSRSPLLKEHVIKDKSSGTEAEVQDDSSRSGNDTNADDADIRPIYDKEPMAKVQLTAECNIFAIGQQHTEQLEISHEGRIDQYPEQCQVQSHMLDSSLDNQTTEYSKQSLESENILLKKTVAQFQKDFSRMEAHCIALELKYQNQALKSGQHGQILNETSNKAKIKKEIDVLETMNIELEHSVAKLRKENETLKKHYKDLYDSIKITRSKTIEQTTSLLANNADLKAQIQEKVFAIAALKNDLRKLKGNSVDTKFAKTSVLGKPVLQSLRNQSVVRQPNAFKSERPQMSKQRFASQVDVNNNLSRPVTQHYLPKKTESAFAKPDHMIASSSSRNSSKNMPRFSSNDMVHNHYLDEARKKTQERDRNSKTSVMPSVRFQSTTDGSKPKPRSNNQTPRSLPLSKSSCEVTIGHSIGPTLEHIKRFKSLWRSSAPKFLREIDDEDEVNSELAIFTEACQAAYEASKPKVHRTTVERDRYGAHDRLVMAYFSEQPQYDEATFRDNVVIMNLYGEEFLRKPTYTDIEKLYAYHNEKHGFPGMLRSIDCTDWPWANCPVAFKAQFSRGDHGPDPFILLKAIASNDLWILHAFFGVSGMNNDVNVLRQSPIFNDLKSGRALNVPFVVNNVSYKRGYYLTDGIYPKDVERAFGVLKQKWKIIKYPARGMTRSGLSDIMYTCLILHNMIIHDNGNAISPEFFPEEQHRDDDPVRTHQESMQVT
ncbi:gag-pol polyprotein [Tanacetum coccineum]